MTAHPDRQHWWKTSEDLPNVQLCIYDGCLEARWTPRAEDDTRCPSKHPRTLVRCELDAGRHRVHRAGERRWFEAVENPAVRQCQSINPHNRQQAIQCEYPEGPHTAHKRGMWLWWDTNAAPKRTFTARTAWASPTVETLKNFLADLPSEAKLTIAANGNDYIIAADWSE